MNHRAIILVLLSACTVDVPDLDTPNEFKCGSDSDCAEGYRCEAGFCASRAATDTCANCGTKTCVTDDNGSRCVECNTHDYNCDGGRQCIPVGGTFECRPNCGGSVGEPCGLGGQGVCVGFTLPGSRTASTCVPCPDACPSSCQPNPDPDPNLPFLERAWCADAACSNNGDCGAGNICMLDGGNPRCVPTCIANGDCVPGAGAQAICADIRDRQNQPAKTCVSCTCAAPETCKADPTGNGDLATAGICLPPGACLADGQCGIGEACVMSQAGVGTCATTCSPRGITCAVGGKCTDVLNTLGTAVLACAPCPTASCAGTSTCTGMPYVAPTREEATYCAPCAGLSGSQVCAKLDLTGSAVALTRCTADANCAAGDECRAVEVPGTPSPVQVGACVSPTCTPACSAPNSACHVTAPAAPAVSELMGTTFCACPSMTGGWFSSGEGSCGREGASGDATDTLADAGLTIAIDDVGRPWVAWVQGGPAPGIRVAFWHKFGGSPAWTQWNGGVITRTDGGTITGHRSPALAFDPFDLNPVLAWVEHDLNGRPQIYSAVLRDNGTRTTDGSQNRDEAGGISGYTVNKPIGRVVIDSYENRRVAAWEVTEGGTAKVHARRREQNGTWLPIVTDAGVSIPNDSVSPSVLAMPDGGHLVAVVSNVSGASPSAGVWRLQPGTADLESAGTTTWGTPNNTFSMPPGPPSAPALVALARRDMNVLLTIATRTTDTISVPATPLGALQWGAGGAGNACNGHCYTLGTGTLSGLSSAGSYAGAVMAGSRTSNTMVLGHSTDGTWQNLPNLSGTLGGSGFQSSRAPAIATRVVGNLEFTCVAWFQDNAGGVSGNTQVYVACHVGP